MTRKQVTEALRRYGEQRLAEEKERGILPAEQELLDRLR